jgi:hypothetical protein
LAAATDKTHNCTFCILYMRTNWTNRSKLSKKCETPIHFHCSSMYSIVELQDNLQGQQLKTTVRITHNGHINMKQPKRGYAPHNDVSVNDGPHIRRWSHNIIILTIVLQLPTVFSTVTCCAGL